eukprot:1181411-Prorocentrum_minimum.AAC.4
MSPRRICCGTIARIVHRRGVGRWGQPIPPLDRASDWSINIPALPVSDWSIVHRRGVGRWGQPIPPLDRASDWSIVRIYPCFMGLIGSSCTAAAWRGGINLFPPSTGHLIGPS